MSTQPLRDYQHRAIVAARMAFRSGKRAILLVAPTGAGKTRIGVELVTVALSRPGADGVIWVAHRAELLKQAYRRLLLEGLDPTDVDIIAPWAKRSLGARVHVASVSTLAAAMRRAEPLPRARVVVLDEAHHYAADEWGEVALSYRGSTILGLTATPERGDGRGMGDLFDHLIPVSSVQELQRLGVLVPSVVFAADVETEQLSDDPVQAYLAHTPGEMGFCFCATVDHAQQVADGFTAAGHPGAVIHADTPSALRAALIDSFVARDPAPLRAIGSELPVPSILCNVYALTEGVDVPAASVCILARGSSHPGMYLQMVGRVLRAAPGKTRATILDLKGSTLKHGLPEADRAYSLEGNAIELAGPKGEHKPTSCGACGAVFARWRVTDDGRRMCPECKTTGPKMPDPAIVNRKLLRMVGPLAPPEARKAHLTQFAAVASEKSYKPGWVSHRYKLLFGAWPTRAELRAVGVGQ